MPTILAHVAEGDAVKSDVELAMEFIVANVRTTANVSVVQVTCDEIDTIVDSLHEILLIELLSSSYLWDQGISDIL